MKVTRQMRNDYFDAHGTYESDEVVFNWYFGQLEVVKPTEPQKNKYNRTIKGIEVDVYDVLVAWNVTNPATQHAIKKLLQAGQRGHKDKITDLNEAIESILRAIELEGL